MKSFTYTLIFSLFSSFGFSQISMLTNLPPVIAPNSTLSLEVKITKGGVANFSKYQMDVPAGVSITEGNSKTGNFTFESGRAKIVWVSIPSEPEFVITFNMITGTASGAGVFNQKFFYLENGAKQEVEAEPVNVSFDGSGATVAVNLPETGGNNPGNTTNPSSTPPVSETAKTSDNAAPTPTTAPEPTMAAVTKTVEPVKETPPVAVTKTVEPVVTKTVEPAVETPPVAVTETKTKAPEVTAPVKTQPVATTAANTENMVYKVQIGAFGSSPDQNRFKAIGKVNVSQEGGFYKALVGNFSSKEEALQKRQELIGKGFDGFVVAYKNGVRVK